MNSKNIQNLIFGTPRIYLMFLFCVGLTHAQRVDVVDHLGNKAQTGTVVTEADNDPTSPKEGDIWINTNKTPNTTNIYDFDTETWKEVKPSYQSVLQDENGNTKIQLDKNKADNEDEDTIRFDTNGEERMVIRDDGKVGIGISETKDEVENIDNNPHINGKLHINDKKDDGDITVRIQNSTVSDDGDHGKHGSTATLRFSVTPDSRFDSAFVGSDRTNSLILGSNADERMRIDEFGNVGIGRVPSEFREGFHALQVGGDQGKGKGITLLGNDASIGTGYYLKRDIGSMPNRYLYDNQLKVASMLKMSNEEFSFSMAEEKKDGIDNEIEWKEIMKIEDYTAPIITTTAANGDSGLRLKIVGSTNELLRIQDKDNNNLMMLDGSGNLLVGTKDKYPGIGTYGFATGHMLSHEGNAFHSANNNIALSLNRYGDMEGSVIDIRKNGNTKGFIGVIDDYLYIGGNLTENNSAGLQFENKESVIIPMAGAEKSNGETDLGSVKNKFKNIYLLNAPTQTSDRNEKQDIAELSDAEQRVAVACKGLLRKFRWKDSVAEKGDDARIHFGIIAQDLQAAFEAEGLDAGDYAMFINSTWTDEETGEEKSRMGVRYSELLAFIISAI